MTARRLLTLAFLPLATAAVASPERMAPFCIVQQANRTLDPDLAAKAYAPDAALIFDYPGLQLETFRGTKSIRASYVRTFDQVDKGQPVEVEFRFDPSGIEATEPAGIYRASGTARGKPFAVFGRFVTRLVEVNGAWRFAEDRGGPATAADFEKLPSSEPCPQ